MVGASANRGETAITFNVKEDTLKQMVNIEDAIATTFDDLDFVVETLDKTTIEPFDKIVGNVIKVVIKAGQEGIKTS